MDDAAKPLRFTRHARNRLRLWRLSEQAAADVLRAPDTVSPTVHGRSNAWKLLGGRWIRVTFDRAGAVAIITVTVQRRGSEGA